MALSILSNFAANVAHRNLTASDAQASNSVAKLSSGLRVLGAKDDAAGLAIGSRLRAEVSAQVQASVNAGQAVSMLQIADGAMSKVNDILVRMKALAVQAGSDQLGNTERNLIDSEFQQLNLEIERISQDTEFNGQSLIRGVLGGTADFAKAADGSSAATALAADNGIASITFDANSAVESYSLANDGTNLILTNLADGTTESVALPSTLPAAGQTSDIRFATSGVTVTIDDKFDSSATRLLVDGEKAADGITGLSSTLSKFNGVESVQVASGASAASFSAVTAGDGSFTVTNLATGVSETVSNITAPAAGTTDRLNFESLGVVVAINDKFDPALNTSTVETQAIGDLPNAVIGGSTGGVAGIVSLESASGNTGDNLQLTFDSASNIFTLTNLSATGDPSASVQVQSLPATGEVKRLDFALGSETFTLALDENFTGTTAIANAQVDASAIVMATTLETLGNVSLSDATGDLSEINGATINLSATGADATAAVFTLATNTGNFVSTATNLVTGDANTQVTLVHATDSTKTITLTVDASGITAAGTGVGAGTVDTSAVFNNVQVTAGRTNNDGIITTDQSGDTGRISDVKIDRIRGDVSNLVSSDLTFTVGAGENVVLSLNGGGGANDFTSATLNLVDGVTDGDIFTTTLADGNGNEIDVSFTVGTAFITGDTDNRTVDFSDFFEDVVSNTGATADPKALPNAIVATSSGTPGALSNVTVESVTGSLAGIDANRIVLSNLDTPDNVTFTLSGADGNDFVATGVNLTAATTNTRITLADGQGNSIELEFDVTSVFTGNETLAELDVTGYLDNVVASTGAASTIGASDFTFKIGTGNESYDRITLSLDAVTTGALGTEGLDVTTSANADAASIAVSAAIDTLQSARANVGAFQNRLENAAANLAITRENTEAARSAILDLDVASEIIKFTSTQILVQSGVSMLAQANQLPQNLLRLLQ